MRISNSTRSLLAVALVFMPVYAFAQSGAGVAADRAAVLLPAEQAAPRLGRQVAVPLKLSPGAGSTAINGVTGPANPAGLNNSGNDPSGAGNTAISDTNPAQILQARPMRQDLPLVPVQLGARQMADGRRRN